MLIPARTDTSYFHDYIYHQAEIRFIRGRLRFTDETVEAVGAAVGVPDPNYFARLFRRVEGVSPRAFRNRWRE